jgi:hypothetical protein
VWGKSCGDAQNLRQIGCMKRGSCCLIGRLMVSTFPLLQLRTAQCLDCCRLASRQLLTHSQSWRRSCELQQQGSTGVLRKTR